MNPTHTDPNRTTPATIDGDGTRPSRLRERTETEPRFQVLRPHARGGLGEVFVARDGELNREVALKEMREEFADDAGSRTRFLREAEITGGLEHPGIVPVYGLGRYADGRPFYAMRFIQGDSLEEAIRRFHAADQAGRDPGERSLELRRLLTRFVAVCEAVAYAHSRGVLHRDLKPANIMLGAYGETLVVDWGLAKALPSQARSASDGPSAGMDTASLQPQSMEDVAATQPGAVLGTPAYMSLEQAAGRLDQLCPATDTYGLGATLYCLLTGRAPFTGTNRGEILRRVRQGELMAPRQVRSAVPRALEAICLKAMALRPEERYPSAKALAADVEHWLADEPVSAYHEPLRARVGRWARRHRPLVAGLSALLLAVLVLGGGGLGWWQWRQALVEAAATEDLTRAEEMLAKDAPAAEVLQVAERAEGRLADGGMERLRERARQLRAWVAFAGRLEQARQQAAIWTKEGFDFAGGDRAYAEVFAEHGLDVAALPPEEAAARIRSAPIRARLVAALDDWAYAKDRLRADGGEPLRAVARLADNDEWRQTLRDPAVRKDRTKLETLAQRADTLAQPLANVVLLSRALQAVGGTAAAERLLRQAQQRHPNDFWINSDLAGVLKRPEEAAGLYRAALALQPRSEVIRNNLGNVLHAQGKLIEAEAEYRTALRIKSEFAEAHNNLGNVLYAQGKLTEAEAEYRAALRIKPDAAEAHTGLGNVLHDRGKLAEAEAEHHTALRLKPDCAEAHANLGNFLRAQGKPAEAEAEYRAALRIKPDFVEVHAYLGNVLHDGGKLTEAEAEYRAVLRIKPDTVEAHYNLGNALSAQGKLPEAEAEYHTALRIKPDFPDAHCNLGHVLRRQGQFIEALSSFQRGHELGAKMPGWRYPSAQWVREAKALADLDLRLSKIRKGEAQAASAAECIQFASFCLQHKQLTAAAARFYADAFAQQPKLAEGLRAWHRYNAACVAALAGCGRGKDTDKLDDKERAHLRKQALDWLRADLTAWGERLNKEPDKARAEVLARMKHWQQDTDFAGVRGDAVDKLPEPERAPWRKLWDDVEALRRRAAERK